MSLLVTPERAAELKAEAKDIPVYDLSPGQTDLVELFVRGAAGLRWSDKLWFALPPEPRLALRDAEGVILLIATSRDPDPEVVERAPVLRECNYRLWGFSALELPTRYDSQAFRLSPEDLDLTGKETVGVFCRKGLDAGKAKKVRSWLEQEGDRFVVWFLPASTMASGDFPHLPLQRQLAFTMEELPKDRVKLLVVPFPGDLPNEEWQDLENDILEKYGCKAAPENWSDLRESVDDSSHGSDPATSGFTVFFTGLSGSGKSTVARHLQVKLLERGGRNVSLLDGDLVRQHLSSELGFSKEHRDINIRRIGYVASEVTKHGGAAVCCPIAPYDSTRQAVRSMIEPLGGFALVHISTPVEVCEARDRKGLYAKARAGIIKEFTGISDPYETPENADLSINTDEVSAADAADRVIGLLDERGYLSKT